MLKLSDHHLISPNTEPRAHGMTLGRVTHTFSLHMQVWGSHQSKRTQSGLPRPDRPLYFFCLPEFRLGCLKFGNWSRTKESNSMYRATDFFLVRVTSVTQTRWRGSEMNHIPLLIFYRNLSL